MNKWPWNQDGGYAGLSDMNLHHPGLIWIKALLNAQSVNSRDNLETPKWHYFLGDQSVTLQVNYISLLLSWKE